MSDHETTGLIKVVTGPVVLPPSTVADERIRDSHAMPRYDAAAWQEAC